MPVNVSEAVPETVLLEEYVSVGVHDSETVGESVGDVLIDEVRLTVSHEETDGESEDDTLSVDVKDPELE